MKKHYYVYMLVSKDDLRAYIGYRGSFNKPAKDTKYMSSSKAVTKEYLQNCVKYILKTFDTAKEALEHEVYLHALYNVDTNPAFFNLSKQTSTKFSCTGPMKQSQRDAIGNANKIARNTPESKEKQRQLRLGVTVSDSTKQKLRALNLGAKSAKARKVLCVETGTIYGALSEAATAIGIHYSNIAKVCAGKHKTAGGYTWKYITK
jgi:hypothetical protein